MFVVFLALFCEKKQKFEKKIKLTRLIILLNF